ncbi:flocculation protein FLO11 isoform X2 [Pieris rapae]|uniref:flocculation protein FLO11 isoform X2 n=1 Tax=Pieris rapae TaxID=64459 RepID=UPI001E27F14B|nr:flocculation protein FLO11 isoform X2 [Pieris rapae]
MQTQICIAVLLFCVVCQVQGAVNCTSAGRYADPVDTTCKNYTLCVLTTGNSFISYEYTCPTTSLFSPISRTCTTNYVCNTTNTTNTTTSICTVDGFVANPSSTGCTSYIQCVQINGTFVETVLSCPNGTLYNPNTTLCDASYNCPSAVSVTCSSVGRIPDTTDTTCQRYFLCVLAANGTLIQYSYTCPTSSVFSPVSNVCTTTYTCP